MLHRCQIVIIDDLFEYTVESIERSNPVLQVRTRPVPASNDDGRKQSGKFIFCLGAQRKDERCYFWVGRRTLPRQSFDLHLDRTMFFARCATFFPLAKLLFVVLWVVVVGSRRRRREVSQSTVCKDGINGPFLLGLDASLC